MSEEDEAFEDGWLQAVEVALVLQLKTLQGDTEAHWKRIRETVEFRVFGRAF